MMTKLMSVFDGFISSTRRSKGCRTGEAVDELMIAICPAPLDPWIESAGPSTEVEKQDR